MKIDWSAYKITLSLYIGVLLLPISFYFAYSSFKELRVDTKAVNQLTLNSALVLSLHDVKQENLINKINLTFEKLQSWMAENDNKDFYVGTVGLLQRYELTLKVWEEIKENKLDRKASFFKETQLLIFSLNNMLELKQNKIYNLFYINLFATMILFLLLISFTRGYIHQQLSKHAIYDLKTNLYTKEYLLATLKEVISKTTRTQEALSAIYIDAYELNNLNKSHKDELLKYIGKSLLDSLRLSDVICRYGEHEFVVILPNTNEEHFDLLRSRLSKDLSKVSCEIKAIRYNPNESHTDFLERLV